MPNRHTASSTASGLTRSLKMNVLITRISFFIGVKAFSARSLLRAAHGINDRRQIVGVYDDSRAHGFLLDKGTFATIDSPGALSRSPRGPIIVVRSSGSIPWQTQPTATCGSRAF